MAKWVFEPGHTGAEFCVKHMMVTWVRGCFKNIEGTMEFDPDNPVNLSVKAEIDAASLWSGDEDRDNHLRHHDFLDVENHPKIAFSGDEVHLTSINDFRLTGDLTIRGITHSVTIDMRYLGQWDTPFWQDGVDRGPVRRAGFVAETRISREDYEIDWNGTMEKGGLVVGDDVLITIDIEALLQQ
jgi:polyisoprenoid-binding protein YceI